MRPQPHPDLMQLFLEQCDLGEADNPLTCECRAQRDDTEPPENTEEEAEEVDSRRK